MNVKENGDGKGRFRTIESDDQGNFTFGNILPGTYVVQALPVDKTYRPGYFKSNSEAPVEWKDAEQITVTENSEVSLEIALGLSQGRKGIARIKGNVRKGKGVFKGDDVQGVEVVAGTVVTATDQFGNVTDWAVSDNMGNYELSELNQGTYTLVTDRIDYNATQVSVQTDYTTRSDVQTDINISTSVTTDVNENEVLSSTTFIYPNPAVNAVNVQFEGEGPVAKLTIVNSLGSTVAEMNLNVTNGTMIVPMSVENLSTGAYFIHVQQGANLSVSTFTVQR